VSTVNNQNSLIRPIVIGGLILGTLRLIDTLLIVWLTAQTPPLVVAQFFASGALGDSAFAGGLATALLGVIIHYGVSFVISAVFILSASRLPVLRRNAILGGLLYGVAVYFVMNFIVLPLSAAPPLEYPLPILIYGIIMHALEIGLPLGIIVRRNANAPVTATA
jgi:hypothetical protein